MQAKQLLKIIISLFLHTSLQSPPPPLFLAFLWTKFICTETAQRFSFLKRKNTISPSYNIIYKLTTPYQIRQEFIEKPSLPTYYIIISNIRKQQRWIPTNSYQKREILSTPILISIGLFISPLSLSVQYLQ